MVDEVPDAELSHSGYSLGCTYLFDLEFTVCLTDNWYLALKDFAGPAATVIASAVAAWIAFHFGRVQARMAGEQVRTAAVQVQLAHVRLQHDLYDRRYKLYDVSRRFILKVTQHHNVEGEWVVQYTGDIGDAVFLLDAETADY